MKKQEKTPLPAVSSRTVVGWAEYVGLPDWGIKRVRAKIDTGARTSALHVEDLETLQDGFVRFHVVFGKKPSFRRVEIRARVLRWGRVRSSTGHYSVRCFVKTRVRIGPVEKEIELSLVSRERMLYRMLLGRTALGKDFLVDTSKRGVLSKKRKRPRKARHS